MHDVVASIVHVAWFIIMDLDSSPLNDVVGIANEMGENAELSGRTG